MHRRANIAILACAVTLLASGCGGQRTSQQPAQPPVQKPITVTQPSGSAPDTATQPSGSAPATAPDTRVTTGQTEDGHHYWGAPDAPVTMIDFSDFM